ncbi:MAG TPA: xanthine dehydrogenase family protein subunit M [Rhodobacteraceae bacterium]|nr:xanthine dehydrogenase family protein subunit M [Paracoccaceae bacterium]
MRYVVAKDSREAVALLNTGEDARLLAGGTDVLVQLKLGYKAPSLLVDIKAINGFSDISAENGGFRIGAVVSGAEMGEHADLKAMWPGVVEAVELIGSTQVQGRATMVGNLCNGSPAADAVPAMLAAGAIARIEGPSGKRDMLVADLLEGPGKTKLGKAELISSVYLPARPERSGDAYLRFIPRTEMDIAVASAGVSLVLDENGTVADASVALGAVAPTAVFVPDAEAALVGSKLNEQALKACAAACAAACNPIDDKRGTVEFRTKVAGVMATRAAKIAYSRAGGQL